MPILYIDPNCYCSLEQLHDEEFVKDVQKTEYCHKYNDLDDFIEAFNNGYISDEGYLIKL